MTSPSVATQPTLPRQYLWVFAGGMVGTFARWVLSTALPRVSLAPSSGNYLWDIWGLPGLSLMLCNAVGAGMLGALVSMYPNGNSKARVLWGTGALGAFTSFSALASVAAGLEASSAQLRAGLTAMPTFAEVAGGFCYCIASLLVGVIAALAGRVWGAGIRGTQVVHQAPQATHTSPAPQAAQVARASQAPQATHTSTAPQAPSPETEAEAGTDGQRS
ncbi:fluoride efflux transporter FluC [Corynebacterium auriscanis]|uniref:fluoride efflux transporter FluC n=1 Tax=Corynebacterium auriscanis TaxID=99807 RepID=UPI0022474DDB|nr:CrcB family protein [Corynebacterium auriscanis]MCX2163680.1 CrcB family protein [Corynebacterium auriscanis]